MIKKVEVSKLRPGIFIHDFGANWFNHPFLGQKKLIKDHSEIERIKEYGIFEVFIDTRRGLDISEPVDIESWKKSFGDNKALVEKFTLEQSKWVPLEKELVRAVEIKNKAHSFVNQMNESVKNGKKPELDQAAELVDEMVESLARNKDALLTLTSIKNKDEYTFNHSINVAVLMASFCRFMNLDETQMHHLTIGALFHDLGKVLVPGELITKPGRYTDEEYTMMKQHPRLGKELLSEMTDINEDILNVVYQHHERMDGNGYPEKITGHNISLGGRMASIVDVYDALTSIRSYKEAESATEVLKFLFQSAPDAFDLELLQQFISSVGIFPVGSLVRLNSGFLAVVVESAKKDLTRPKVKMIYDIKKGRSIVPRKLDLSEGVGELHQITGTENPQKWDINLENILLST